MRRVLLTILILVLVSPLFGVIGAELVGYHEPLEVAAEIIGLEEGEPLWSGILPDYTFPGLPDVIGYIIAGLIGVGVLLIPAMLKGRGKDIER
ncbi:MAG TPA: cobalamin biosynthesis protein [Candidatus Korarchaeota archaeon]|nr:cobalamin biosynthesis protein [Candidatus Korarchaeota archaeon]